MNEKYDGDTERVYDFFNSNHKKYGYSPKSLGWIKGKQNIRFAELTRFFNLSIPFAILDIGCGFGDINKYFVQKNITNYTYHGIDLVEGIVNAANDIYKGQPNISFSCGEFLTDMSDCQKYDYVIASGIFNFQMNDIDNYVNVEEILKKSLSICNPNGAVSFDFQSDKADYFADNGVSFYNSPEKILSIAYKYSRNVALNNLYMPFEFSLTVFKDDSFAKSNLVFNKFIDDNKKEFDKGIYYEEIG
ncbi:MAG: class I SAM-dependent methyltransferase [Lachnospiraceae bacterium]|nr:class I SAM-dependent methyltransferase [Lachnospiraceae bacterium]